MKVISIIALCLLFNGADSLAQTTKQETHFRIEFLNNLFIPADKSALFFQGGREVSKFDIRDPLCMLLLSEPKDFDRKISKGRVIDVVVKNIGESQEEFGPNQVWYAITHFEAVPDRSSAGIKGFRCNGSAFGPFYRGQDTNYLSASQLPVVVGQDLVKLSAIDPSQRELPEVGAEPSTKPRK